jgi:uncharacterized coiled-coil DUF342 family protein
MKVGKYLERIKVGERIILYFSLGILIFYLFVLFIEWIILKRNAINEKIEEANNLSSYMASFVAPSILLGDVISIKTDIQPFSSSKDLAVVAVKNKDGNGIVVNVFNTKCLSCHSEDDFYNLVDKKGKAFHTKGGEVIIGTSEVNSEGVTLGRVFTILLLERAYKKIYSAFGRTTLFISILFIIIIIGGYQTIKSSVIIPLRRGTEVLNTAVKDAVKTVVELQTGTSEQAASITELAGNSEEIASSAAQIGEMTRVSENLSREGSLSAEESEKAVDEVIKEIFSVKEKVNDMAKRIVQLSELSQRIGNINTLIEDISDQTRLLAVNASIEAVGAGEAGRRFGVVAGEIRNLSLRTREATENVRKLVEEILSSITNTVMITEEGVKSFEALSERVQRIKEVFSLLKEKANEVYKISIDIKEATAGQAGSSAQMARALEEIKEVANKIAEGGIRLSEIIKKVEEIMKEIEKMV